MLAENAHPFTGPLLMQMVVNSESEKEESRAPFSFFLLISKYF